eukprot:CAMPEP_0204821460 /NCGR_PEP_ID=MMETSP1018-20131115/20411_1 /ASSEMBLY_ACC=CAM_ASM_000518 /TAXON_ID=46462 /ORGANISM="Anophryoides haemophila, Strain AH6" /LENGTH=68 /DNA_ID=CAMNT_0051932103 /DNA_START=438 /DNA_END=644 /DNA_ORIENTATION=+
MRISNRQPKEADEGWNDVGTGGKVYKNDKFSRPQNTTTTTTTNTANNKFVDKPAKYQKPYNRKNPEEI